MQHLKARLKSEAYLGPTAFSCHKGVRHSFRIKSTHRIKVYIMKSNHVVTHLQAPFPEQLQQALNHTFSVNL